MKKELSFFDNQKNVRRFLLVFYISLGVLLAVDPFIHKHSEYGWETSPGFFAAYGFVSCVMLIFVARVLRYLIMRDEQYYN